ncbi:MAG: hypothetical protein IME98_05425 [Proteobacteria bacterium]|nr:hypothetical protein [Pseudomonadota bacterium]
MKKSVLSFCAAMALVFSFFIIPDSAEAVPAFARQTGMSCNTCHYQHFPALNQMGRAFKASGYTMVGGQDMIEADMLSLPVSLNASLVTKIRYKKSDGHDSGVSSNHGVMEFPDEGALIIGGRAGDNVGLLIELQLKDPGSSAWASFKMPFIYVLESGAMSGATLGITPFTTDAAGASYGHELLNTGALRMQRVLESRKAISAQQYIGTAMEATGVTFSFTQPLYFANLTAWSPEHAETDANPSLVYLRGAYMPTVAGWDLAIGFQWWDGDTFGSGASPCATSSCATEAFAIDAQAQGLVDIYPVGVYFTYAQAAKSSPTLENFFNTGTNDDKTAVAILGEVGVIPNRLTLSLAFLLGDTGGVANNEDNATTLGAVYMLAQNVQLQANHTFYSGSYYDIPANNELAGGDNLTTLMIFAAF